MVKNKRMLGALVAVVPLVLGVTGCHHRHHYVPAPPADMSGPHFTPSRDTGESSPAGYEMLQKDKHALLNVKDPGACAAHSRPASQCDTGKSIWDFPSARDRNLFGGFLSLIKRSQDYHQVHPEDYGNLPSTDDGKKLLEKTKHYIHIVLTTPNIHGAVLDYFKDKKAAVPHLIDELWERSFSPESMWDLLDWSGEYGFTDLLGQPGTIDYKAFADYAAFPKYRRPHN